MLQRPPGAVLGASKRQPGSEEASGGPRDRFWEPFWLQKRCFSNIFRASAAYCFSHGFCHDFCSNFFPFEWFPPCARKRRTRRSYRENHMNLSIFRFMLSRRRAPRRRKNTHNHTRKHLQNVSTFVDFSYFFRSRGVFAKSALPEGIREGRREAPGPSRAPPGE